MKEACGAGARVVGRRSWRTACATSGEAARGWEGSPRRRQVSPALLRDRVPHLSTSVLPPRSLGLVASPWVTAVMPFWLSPNCMTHSCTKQVCVSAVASWQAQRKPSARGPAARGPRATAAAAFARGQARTHDPAQPPHPEPHQSAQLPHQRARIMPTRPRCSTACCDPDTDLHHSLRGETARSSDGCQPPYCSVRGPAPASLTKWASRSSADPTSSPLPPSTLPAISISCVEWSGIRSWRGRGFL
jgi:hypothetical protein